MELKKKSNVIFLQLATRGTVRINTFGQVSAASHFHQSEVHYFLSGGQLKPSFLEEECSLLHRIFSVSLWLRGRVDGLTPAGPASRLIPDHWGGGWERGDGVGGGWGGLWLWPDSCVPPAACWPTRTSSPLLRQQTVATTLHPSFHSSFHPSLPSPW